ncbi:MAG: hypothetical protein AAGA62_12575 [Bacteroidota bacterium]
MMRIVYLGAPPDDLQIGTWPEAVQIIPYDPSIPLFEIDAVLEFGDAAFEKSEGNELFLKSGRPCIAIPSNEAYKDFDNILAGIKMFGRTNYQPINCNFYDNFEAAIVTKRSVELVYLDVWGEPVTTNTQLADLKTKQTEEYVQLASGEWLRLDRIVSVDGIAAGASCRF